MLVFWLYFYLKNMLIFWLYFYFKMTHFDSNLQLYLKMSYGSPHCQKAELFSCKGLMLLFVTFVLCLFHVSLSLYRKENSKLQLYLKMSYGSPHCQKAKLFSCKGLWTNNNYTTHIPDFHNDGLHRSELLLLHGDIEPNPGPTGVKDSLHNSGDTCTG
jgi:hypothetical protein